MYFFKSFLRVILRIKKEKIRRYKELVKKIKTVNLKLK